jgi:hypothetical protein
MLVSGTCLGALGTAGGSASLTGTFSTTYSLAVLGGTDSWFQILKFHSWVLLLIYFFNFAEVGNLGELTHGNGILLNFHGLVHLADAKAAEVGNLALGFAVLADNLGDSVFSHGVSSY